MWFLLKLVALAALIVAAKLGGEFVQDSLHAGSLSHDMLRSAVVVLLFVYTLLIAIPFLPGIEIGLALLASGGPQLALPVFLCTWLGLLISFGIGRLFPPHLLVSMLQDLQLESATRVMKDMQLRSAAVGPLPATGLPSRVIPLLRKHRNVALAVALNTPGNALVGGGGGIALAAGISSLYSWRSFLLTTALAISPVPLIVLICGGDFIG